MIKLSEVLENTQLLYIANVIYKLTNTVNGKVYIGQTSISFKKRLLKHIYDARTESKRRKHYLQRALVKYGFDNFTVEILETCDKEKLDEREIYWIAHFKATDPKLGYNCTYGGQGNRSSISLSDEARRIISETHKQKWADPEYRTMQKQHRKHSYDYKKVKIVQLDLSYNFVKIWESKTAVANEFTQQIYRLRGNRKQVMIGNYLFMILDDYKKLELDNPIIVQLDQQYNIVNKYYSYRDANMQIKAMCGRRPNLKFDANQVRTKKKGTKKAGYIWMTYENYMKYKI